MLLAKTVVPNQYWILRDHDGKVGNIQATDEGLQVKINNQVETFKSLSVLKRRVKIDFENIKPTDHKRSTINEVNGYPTTSTPYNAIYDVKHQVPLWTREPRSKSWYAAGWYAIKQGRRWTTMECPKLIALERYQYIGPFRNQQEAADVAAHQ